MPKLFPSPSAIFAVLLGLVVLPVSAVSAPADPPSAPAVRADVPTQLPRGVVPTHYEISVTPDAGALTFRGRAAISIEVLEPTARITLNAIDLTFATVQLAGGAAATALAAPKVTVDAAAQTATFTFAGAIPRGA